MDDVSPVAPEVNYVVKTITWGTLEPINVVNNSSHTHVTTLSSMAGLQLDGGESPCVAHTSPKQRPDLLIVLRLIRDHRWLRVVLRTFACSGPTFFFLLLGLCVIFYNQVRGWPWRGPYDISNYGSYYHQYPDAPNHALFILAGITCNLQLGAVATARMVLLQSVLLTTTGSTSCYAPRPRRAIVFLRLSLSLSIISAALSLPTTIIPCCNERGAEGEGDLHLTFAGLTFVLQPIAQCLDFAATAGMPRSRPHVMARTWSACSLTGSGTSFSLYLLSNYGRKTGNIGDPFGGNWRVTSSMEWLGVAFSVCYYLPFACQLEALLRDSQSVDARGGRARRLPTVDVGPLVGRSDEV